MTIYKILVARLVSLETVQLSAKWQLSNEVSVWIG